MKISPKKHNTTGAVILAATVMIIILTTTLLLGYFWLLMGQSKTVERSQSWNRAMVMAEAGVEEAFAQLNRTNADAANFSANGWTEHSTTNPLVSSYGPPGERILSDGSYYSSFMATPESGVGATATIYSTGSVTAPLSKNLISRRVQVIAREAPLFADAIDAKNSITLNGNSIATKAWNSYSPTLSTNGQCWPGHTLSTGASVGIESGTAGIKNDTVDGNIYLGPGVTPTPPASDATGSVTNDNNLQIPDVSLPPVLWSVASPTNIVTSSSSTNRGVVKTTYTTNTIFDFTQSGDYQIPAADGSIPIQVEAGVTATLDIKSTSFSPGSVSLMGAINNVGTAIIYQESGTASLNTALGTYRPQNFIYYGLPGVNGTLSLNGNSLYIGVIYAPEATVKVNGSPATIEGSVTVGSFTMDGNATVYYDMSLATNAVKGFVPISWREF